MGLDLSMLDAASIAPSASHLPPKAPPEAFEEDPEQPRFEFDEDEEFIALVDDVKCRGILQPLVVRRMPSGRLRIRFGARRYRACVRAGLVAIPYIETEDERQLDDYAQVAENARRKPLQPMEVARFVMRKLAAGESKKAVASKLDVDASAITHLLTLVEDPPPLLLELYHSRRCRAPYYLYLLRKLLRRDAAFVEDRLAAAATVDIGLIENMTRQLRERTMALRNTMQPPADAPLESEPVVAAESVIAASMPRERSPTLSKPQLLGTHEGRALELLLHRRPDTDGAVWVRYEEDGAIMQIQIVEVSLRCLRHQRA
jgi:ParB family chromosome partitioning protein